MGGDNWGPELQNKKSPASDHARGGGQEKQPRSPASERRIRVHVQAKNGKRWNNENTIGAFIGERPTDSRAVKSSFK